MATHAHQIFVIARIRPWRFPEEEMRYKCVAALHHERCYGHQAVRAMHRCLVLVKQKENAEIARAELRCIDGQYGQGRGDPRIPDVSCPYIAFLVGAAYTTDLGTPGQLYGSHVTLLSADMGSTEAATNGDGVSMIDLTDPLRPAYCFASVRGLSSLLSAHQPQELHPLSATQYLRAYQHPGVGGGGADISALTASFQGYQTIDRRALFEAWPDEYGSEIFRTSIDISTRMPHHHLPSLADVALGPAIVHALEADDFSGIEDLLIMPGRADVVRNHLKNMRPIPESATSLLIQILKAELQDRRLDLSDFWLSTEQILDVVAPARQDLESLNLSFNPSVSVNTVRSIIVALPRLRRLVLMGCSSLSDRDLVQLCRRKRQLFRNMESLIHPFVLSFESSPMNCLSVVIQARNHGMAAATVSFATPKCIVQNLTDYLKIFVAGNPNALEMASRRPWMTWAAFAAAPRREGQSWAERSLVCIPSFSNVATESGEGWVFLLSDDGEVSQPRGTWGFIRSYSSGSINSPKQTSGVRIVNGSTIDWEIHDLHSFLQIISEGQEEAPENAVQELQEIMDRLRQEQNVQMLNSRDLHNRSLEALRRR